MNRARVPIYVFYSLVLGLFFPLLVVYLIISEESEPTQLIDVPVVLLGAGVILYSTVRIIRLSDNLPTRFMSVCFFVFIYIWLGLIPIYQLGTGQVSWRIVLPAAYYYEAYFVTYLGIIAYEIGYKLQKSPRMMVARRPLTPSIRGIVAFALFSVTLAAWFGPVSTPMDLLLSNREELAAGLVDVGGDRMSRLVSFALMRTPILIALLVTLWRLRVDNRNRVLLVVVLVLITPFFLIVNFPTALSRTWLGTIVISIAIIFIVTARRHSTSFFSLTLVCALMTLYPLAHYMRSASYGSSGTLSESIIDTYSAGSFDVFAMIAHTVYFLDQNVAPTWGYQLLGPIFFWVPRSVWSSKPIGTGEMIADGLGFDFTNVSAPLWAEGMINFGYPGVVLFFVLFGLISRMLELRITKAKLPTFGGLVVVFGAGFQFIVLRGDLLTVATLAAPYFLFLCLLFWRSYLEWHSAGNRTGREPPA